MSQDFKSYIDEGYTFKGDYIVMGTAMQQGECTKETLVKIPLKTLNRHGLIAGATGTGKSKTLQIIAEELSLKGVPSLLMDVKGDLSGIAQSGTTNKHVVKRHDCMGIPWEGHGTPVELMSISEEKGVRLRATVSEFGPVLLSKILNLNDTQSGIVSLLFKYCDDNKLPLLDLQDLKKTLQYINGEGKLEIKELYGTVSSTSVSTIMRKIIELEQQNADVFFGEESFDVDDLCRTTRDGKGIVSIIRLTDIQNRPKLFSTFMLCLLAEIYNTFPEQGDSEKPKLMLFIDEAHLVFNEASDALMDQIETIIKLIRSKGVGIFFCTQNPTDIPDAVLSQLGLKVQHALRAFTAKDRKAIKKTAENFPDNEFYKTDEILTSLGIGEALITALDEKGRPTPLAATLLRAPASRMDILSTREINNLVRNSDLVRYYDKEIDRMSAYEILKEKIEEAQEDRKQEELKAEQEKVKPRRRKSRKDQSAIEALSKNTMVRQLGRTLMREVARGLLGHLGVKSTRRR